MNKLPAFLIACLIWLAMVFMAVGVYSVAHPYMSSYEGGFYQCLSLSQPGWYECGQGSYLLNVATDRYLAVLLVLIVAPYQFFLMFAFYPETSGIPWYQIALLFVSMPYVFIPIIYFALYRFNLFLQKKSDPRLGGGREKELTNVAK